MRAVLMTLAMCGLWATGAMGQAAEVPLLDRPVGVGLIYSDTDPAARPSTDRAWGMALKRGVNTYQLAVPWDRIAGADGTPDLTFVEPLLDQLQQAGLGVFFTLQSVDTNALRLPASMLDPNDPRRLRPGLSFDSPEVIGALVALLDQLVPMLVEHGGFALSLGNEVDIWLGANPDQAFPVAVFGEWGRQHARSLEPDLAVGLTITRESLVHPDLALLMISVSDAAMFTYYPVDGVVLDPSVIEADFNAMVALAGGKRVLLQEAGVPGAPSDGSPSVLGASDELQRAWVAAVFREMREREAFRFVSWLHLSDHPPAVVSFFEQYYGTSDPAFVEFIAGLGLMTDQGEARPALRELMVQLRRTARPALEPRVHATP